MIRMAQNSMTPAQMDWSSEVRREPMPMHQVPSSGVMANYTPIASADPYYHISYEDLRGEEQQGQMGMPLDMSNPLTQEEMANPMSNSEAYYGSLKNLLGRNLGQYVVATFQMSGQGTVSVPGILYTVGNDYIVLYQPVQGRYVTGDLYALKFVDFHDADSVPQEYRRQ